MKEKTKKSAKGNTKREMPKERIAMEVKMKSVVRLFRCTLVPHFGQLILDPSYAGNNDVARMVLQCNQEQILSL